MSAQNLSKLMPITNTEYRPLNLASVSGGGSGGRASPAERNRDSLLMGGRDSIWSNSSAGSGASFKSASYSDFSSQAPTTGSSQASSVTSSTTVASFRPDSVASSTGSMLSDSSSSMFMQNLRYGPTTRPVTPQLPMSMTMQMQNFVPPVAPAGSSRVLSRKPSVANMLLRGTKHVAEREQRERERDSTIHAFVFSDLVLLTTIVEEAVAPSPKLGWNRRGSGSSPQMEATRALPRYNVLEKCGLARVLSVVDHSGKSPGECDVRLALTLDVQLKLTDDVFGSTQNVRT